MFLLLGASFGISAVAQAAVNINQHGLTGAWANPATEGQGMVIDLYPDLLATGNGYVFGAWYTYDTTSGGADHNRWYTYQADVTDGASSADVVIYRSTGGTFAANGGTTTVAVGTGTLAFGSCTSASFTYAFDDGRSGTIPLTRLMPDVECDDAVNPPPPIRNDFGLSGAWADTQTSAQGLLIEVNPNSANIFVGWFTYAAPGTVLDEQGQRWVTAQHPYVVGDRTFALDLYETTGGLFDHAGSAQTNLVGTATLTYNSCTSADFDYAFTAGDLQGRTGTLHLSRIAFVPATCAF